MWDALPFLCASGGLRQYDAKDNASDSGPSSQIIYLALTPRRNLTRFCDVKVIHQGRLFTFFRT